MCLVVAFSKLYRASFGKGTSIGYSKLGSSKLLVGLEVVKQVAKPSFGWIRSQE